ncbi:MAG: phosphatidylglycerophosphatase A [Candidatus Dadabacteria bacterium]|nr:MAG: phosphatidylglycerophosphatase A [Candidatus Dadabacteria bacterium]
MKLFAIWLLSLKYNLILSFFLELSYHQPMAEKESKILKALSLTLATGLGSGYSPVVSGTCGSAVCLIFWLVVHYFVFPWTPITTFIAALICTVVGLIATAEALKYLKGKDPSQVVIDEWAGMLVTLVAVPTQFSLMHILAAFFFFRFFDVVKPFPARELESLPGALGVMIDDIVAGGYSAIMLWSIFHFLLKS